MARDARDRAATTTRALGDVAVRIEHIGSTAVPRVAAKPIIDIDVYVRPIEPMARYKEPLEALGYLFKFDPETPGLHFLGYPAERPRRFAERAVGLWRPRTASSRASNGNLTPVPSCAGAAAPILASERRNESCSASSTRRPTTRRESCRHRCRWGSGGMAIPRDRGGSCSPCSRTPCGASRRRAGAAR